MFQGIVPKAFLPIRIRSFDCISMPNSNLQKDCLSLEKGTSNWLCQTFPAISPPRSIMLCNNRPCLSHNSTAQDLCLWN